jgi:hypothetical protein
LFLHSSHIYWASVYGGLCWAPCQLLGIQDWTKFSYQLQRIHSFWICKTFTHMLKGASHRQTAVNQLVFSSKRNF